MTNKLNSHKYYLLVLQAFLLGQLLSFPVHAQQQFIYEVPPSSQTRAHVPWIPDEDMENCVILYNEAKWLSERIRSTYVNRYNREEVNSYNAMVTKHKSMIDFFNSNCAGKQSKSAYEAAQRLNEQQQEN